MTKGCELPFIARLVWDCIDYEHKWILATMNVQDDITKFHQTYN